MLHKRSNQRDQLCKAAHNAEALRTQRVTVAEFPDMTYARVRVLTVSAARRGIASLAAEEDHSS